MISVGLASAHSNNITLWLSIILYKIKQRGARGKTKDNWKKMKLKKLYIDTYAGCKQYYSAPVTELTACKHKN